MIKGIMQASRYVYITGGNPSSPNIYSTSNGSNGAGSFVGQVKYNTSNQCLEIFDGSMWHQWHASYANIGLSPEAESILEWAAIKMKEERELERMANENVVIKSLHDEIKEKHEQIKMVQILIKTDETAT